MALVRVLALRSLRSRPLRMLLSTLGIILGVAAILAIGVTNQTALESISRLFEETSGRANLVITSAESEAIGYSETLLPRIQSQPYVAQAVPSIQVQTTLAEEDVPSEIGMNLFGIGTDSLLLFGIDPERDALVREYKIVEGKFLSPDLESNEIVLVESYARNNDLEVGKSVEVITESGIEKLQLVGLMAREGSGQLNNGAFGVLPLGKAQKLFYRQGHIDQIDLIVQEKYSGKEDIESLRQNLQSILGPSYSVIYPAAQGQRMTDMLSNYQIGLNFLSGMALFVGAFLIYNAFSMTVVERTREFGMLRTVGMTRSQITAQVLMQAVVLGLLGSCIGLGLGALLARGLTRLMEVLLGRPIDRAQIPLDIVVMGFSVGIVVTIIAALIPAFQAGRITPLEALRIRSRSGEGWLMRYGWVIGVILLVLSSGILILNPFPYDVQYRIGSLVVFALFVGGALIIPASVSLWERVLRPVIRLLFGNSGRLGSGNIQRAKLRTTLTVAALMIGVAMVVVVWAITDSFKGDLDDWLKSYIGGDLYVSSSVLMGEDVWRHLESVEGVAVATPMRYLEVEWTTPAGETENIFFLAVDPATYGQVTDFQFSQPETDSREAFQQLAEGDAVFISTVLAEKHSLQPGDQLVIRTKSGNHVFRIAAVIVDYYNQGLVINGSWFDMMRYFRQDQANTFLIKVQDGYSIKDVKERIDDRFGKRDRLVIESNQSLLERISVLMQQAFSLFDILALIAMLVGFLGIVNTLTMNVIERTRDIGMLRGVGMTQIQVVVMVLAEAAIIGFMGGVLGLVFGAILSRILLMAMNAMSGYQLEYFLSIQRILAALVAALIVSQLAALFPALRAARIRILDAIHYE